MNGIAEKTVKRDKEGTWTILLQSRFDEQWWSSSMECYCYLRCVQGLSADGKDLARLHQFGKKVLSSICLAKLFMCGEAGKETYALQTLRNCTRMPLLKFMSKESTQKMFSCRKGGGTFISPCVICSVKSAGNGSGVRPSDRIRQETDEPDSAEPRQEQHDLEAKREFWSISGSFTYRHHGQERQKQYVSRVSSFPIPLKFIDAVRRPNPTLDVLQEGQI